MSDWGDQWPEMRLESHFGDRVVPCFQHRPQSLYALLQMAVQNNPAGDALVCGTERLRYSELLTKSSQLATGLAMLASGLTGSMSWAQTWPTKLIKLIVPFASGGANDLLARAAAEGATKVLGQPVVIDNKPGAGGTLGTMLGIKSAPDGYTFLISAAGVISNTMIKKSAPYKDNELVPVVMIGLAPSIIVTSAKSKNTTLKEFIENAKQGQGAHFALLVVLSGLRNALGHELNLPRHQVSESGCAAPVRDVHQACGRREVGHVDPQVAGGAVAARAEVQTAFASGLHEVFGGFKARAGMHAQHQAGAGDHHQGLEIGLLERHGLVDVRVDGVGGVDAPQQAVTIG